MIAKAKNKLPREAYYTGDHRGEGGNTFLYG